jgi:tetratricopeptide (TPR) repeat protein
MPDHAQRRFDAHLHVAEAGKLAALRGDHASALLRYREALRLAAEQQAPDMFRRHYLEISLESLELLGELNSVIECCDRAIAHYTDNPPQSDVAWLDLASIHQRKGAVLMKAGEPNKARLELARALEVGAGVGAHLELARLLHGWIARGLTVPPARITHEQRRLHYFSVRSDTMRSSSESDSLTGGDERAASRPPAHSQLI